MSANNSEKRSLFAFFVLIGCCLCLWIGTERSASADSEDCRLVILQPGYPGSTEEAAEFVKKLSETIGKLGGPVIASGAYYNDEAVGVEAIRRMKPSVGIVSLGVYLKYEEEFSLRAILWSEPKEPFRVLVRKGAFKRLEELDGRSVTGTPLVEVEFVERVLFGPGDGCPSRIPPTWKRTPVKFFSRGIRNVVRGRKDAVLLSEREYQGLKRLRSAGELDLIHTTAAYPAAVVVVFGDRLSPKEVKRLSEALSSFPRSEDGKGLLQEMGIREFGAIDAADLESIQKKHKRHEPVRGKDPGKPTHETKEKKS